MVCMYLTYIPMCHLSLISFLMSQTFILWKLIHFKNLNSDDQTKKIHSDLIKTNKNINQCFKIMLCVNHLIH